MGTIDTIFVDGFQPIGSCPDGQQGVTNVSYSYTLNPVLQNVDATLFQNIFGRNVATAPVVAWPGVNGYAVTVLNRSLYFAHRFTVPSSGLSPTLRGMFTHGESVPGPNLTMAISESCGDFNPPTSTCLSSNRGAGSPMVKWRLPTGTGVACELVPGRTYYANIKLTDRNAVDDNDCDDNACVISVVNNFSN